MGPKHNTETGRGKERAEWCEPEPLVKSEQTKQEDLINRDVLVNHFSYLVTPVKIGRERERERER